MSERMFEDAFNLLCGKKLGNGIHRDVYECALDSTLVVKVEIELVPRSFANVLEHDMYGMASTAAQRWLAPCKTLSPDGRLMLQERCRPLSSQDELPESVPAFLGDVKADNFGWLDGRVVCFDYVYWHPSFPMRMRPISWHF